MKADQVLEVLDEINNNISEASDVKVGDSVMFKKGTHMAGVPAIVQDINKDGKSLMLKIGGATGSHGLVANVPFSEVQKVPSHPGILNP